jgi:hypothetical protein
MQEIQPTETRRSILNPVVANTALFSVKNFVSSMRMVVTSPNVFKQRRPAWLGPFNFFLFPMLSETFGGYPTGFDKSTFVLITPYESDRRKWSSLQGVNLVDGQSYQIAMRPVPN